MLPWWLCGSALPFGTDRPWIDRPREGSYRFPSTENIGPDDLPTFVYFIELAWAWVACQSLFLFWASKIFSFSHKESPRSLQIEERWCKIITSHLVNASQCMCMLSCLVVWNSSWSMDCSPPRSSVHGISQARILEWVAISFSKGIFLTQRSNPRLLHWQLGSLPLSHLGSPVLLTVHPRGHLEY